MGLADDLNDINHGIHVVYSRIKDVSYTQDVTNSQLSDILENTSTLLSIVKPPPTNIDDRLAAIDARLASIEHQQGEIMALVSIEQTDLDTIASTVSGVADDLKTIIDNANPLAPADETALNAAVAKLQALDVVPAPVEEPPVETPPAEEPPVV